MERKEKKAISPIIATLLLILIAIAAGVVVYAYVIGFIGNSTSNSGGTTSVIQITNFCASANTHCSGSYATIVILNAGSVAVSSGTLQVYFTDITQGTSSSFSCTPSPSLPLSPGSSTTCSVASNTNFPTNLAQGDTLSVKLVAPDGGSATSSTKVIG
ncbi:MAG: hypothetical protein M1587_03735 [Thaumarchaeota archaeon]|nr:hypothetical protein [Nitrososphaerota archaeon]